MILADHDPGWAAEFEAIRGIYVKALGARIERVEHVGSTAVPGLMAKPILDIDIVMRDYSAFPGVVAGLRELGYTHNGDQGIAQREAFKPVDGSAPWTSSRRSWMPHHLYVCPADGAELRRHVAFRDMLRAREDLRREYQRLKLAIAGRSGNDRKLYAQIKEVACREFVLSVVGCKE